MLKIFTDECIHTDIILALRESGNDVLTVDEAGLSGSDDEVIFDFARKNKRILLTFDRGFGDIFRFDISGSSGVIIVLISQMLRDEMISIILNFLSMADEGKISGRLVIIGKTKIRISSNRDILENRKNI